MKKQLIYLFILATVFSSITNAKTSAIVVPTLQLDFELTEMNYINLQHLSAHSSTAGKFSLSLAAVAASNRIESVILNDVAEANGIVDHVVLIENGESRTASFQIHFASVAARNSCFAALEDEIGNATLKSYAYGAGPQLLKMGIRVLKTEIKVMRSGEIDIETQGLQLKALHASDKVLSQEDPSDGAWYKQVQPYGSLDKLFVQDHYRIEAMPYELSFGARLVHKF